MPVSDDWSRDEVPTSDAHCFLAMYLDVRSRQPPSEKVHQIIARTALFVSQHGGQSEIVLRVKQGSNPTFGFLMPDHHLHSYFRYLVDHPQLLKGDADNDDTDKGYKTVNSETEHVLSGGALSLLGNAYDSGDEEEGTLPASSKGMDLENRTSSIVQGHGKPASIVPDNEELRKDQTASEEAVGKPILTKKNPVLTGNSLLAAQREKAKDANMKSQNTKSSLYETKEMILEPPSFLKRTMEKIVEFILRNGKEFEEKLIDQDKTSGRFPFLLSSNPYHSYYLKMLQETQESKSRGRSPEKDRRSSERKDRSPSEHKDRRSSSERKDISHGTEDTRSKERLTAGLDARASHRSSAEPSEKQIHDKKGKGKFEIVGGVKKEAPRNVTADEAAAIVMAATRGLGPANDSHNNLKEMRDSFHTLGSTDHSSSFGSLSSLQDRDAPSKHTSNSEADTSLTSSGRLKKEGTGIIDDDWIANTIAKAAAVAASKEADSSEATMTKEQKLKAERLRRAKMFAAIIKSGGSKVNDLATQADQTDEPTKAPAADDMNVTPDLPPAAKEREGSSVPFEREGSIAAKDKDTDDEQNRMRKYRKKHYPESDEEKNDSEESYKPSRKKHRSERSRGHSKDVHKHKHKSHSKDGESRHRRHRHSSSEDEHEHQSSKSRHRHRDHDHYSDDEHHRRSRKHRRDHRSSSKRNYEDDTDRIEQTLGRLEASPSTSGPKIVPEKPPMDTTQSSEGATEVPNELRAKIRAMLLENL